MTILRIELPSEHRLVGEFNVTNFYWEPAERDTGYTGMVEIDWNLLFLFEADGVTPINDAVLQSELLNDCDHAEIDELLTAAMLSDAEDQRWDYADYRIQEGKYHDA